jgi:L,D-transpeptidase catalytic domain
LTHVLSCRAFGQQNETDANLARLLGASTLIKYAALPAALTVLGASGWELTLRAPRVPTLPETVDARALPTEPAELDAGSTGVVRGRASLGRGQDAVLCDEPVAEPTISPARAGDPPRAEADPGAYRSPEVVLDGTSRVYPLTRNVWVRPGPSARDSWIGFLWFGSSVRVRDGVATRGPGCAGRWYPIEPRGYVCVDDDRATLDPEHPAVRGLTRYAPNLDSAWPNRYGESLAVRRYAALPSEQLQRAREDDLRSHRGLVARARAGETIAALLGVDLSPAPEEPLLLPALPKTLQIDRDRLGLRSTVAWTREQRHHGRSFLLASDLKWMPKDRVRPFPTVTFRGVHLGVDAELPLAFFRGRDRPSYHRTRDGQFELASRQFPRLTWVALSDNRVTRGGRTYLETREPGVFVLDSDAVVPRRAEATPWGTPLDAPLDTAAPARGHGTWIEVSILGGWLMAYEGQLPVFATLASAGRGGAAEAGRDPLETASTPTGRFTITGKFATATMVAPNELVHSEVPWAQNFSGPHAIHSAYWHDGWGELESGGCINVSPLDGRWLFREFTEPRLPDGWHGVRWLPELETSTIVLVRRN